MLHSQDVDAIITEVTNRPVKDDRAVVELAFQEVGNLLKATSDSMPKIYADIEAASTRDSLKLAFGRLNGMGGILLGLQLAPENSAMVLEAIQALGVSARMASFLETANSPEDALSGYKSAIVDQLATSLRRRQDLQRSVGLLDDELLSKLPMPCSPVSDTEKILEAHVLPRSQVPTIADSTKRGISATNPLTVIPKKRSKVPALASVAAVMSSDTVDGTPPKKVLMTREMLRAAQLDPRGLLNLVDSSTNALERAKKHELLKTAGYRFNSQNKRSFADKLNAARVRLELGMGAHSNSDALLFGAQVVSSQGALSPRNIRDIENKVVDANTT